MRRLAPSLALLLAASLARGDEPPPAWMPAPPPLVGQQSRQEAKKLRREAAWYTGFGIGVFALGIAVNVVALDVPQSEQQQRVDGNLVTRKVLGDANWAELAGGLALMGTGFGLVWLGYYRRNQARRIEGF
jgi:hypothetical protein